MPHYQGANSLSGFEATGMEESVVEYAMSNAPVLDDGQMGGVVDPVVQVVEPPKMHAPLLHQSTGTLYFIFLRVYQWH